MPRTRITYPVEALYVGPAPSTGYNFVDISGSFNNNYTFTGENFNLIKSIYRVQSISYGFDVNYLDITQMGKQSTVHRAIVNPPTINIDFNYLQQGVVNELRCGFYTNYTQVYGNLAGSAYYSDNFGVGIISGFVTRDLIPGNNELHYPQSYRDKRNLFVVVGKEGMDVNQSTYSTVHPKHSDLEVIGFGNAYITSYGARGAVGQFPTCNMSYMAENMVVYTSGSGVLSPDVDYTTREPLNNKHLNIPMDYQGGDAVTVLRPGDITLDITSLPSYTGSLAIQATGYTGNDYPTLYNLGFNYSDIKIQGYDISLPLNRDSLSSIGHKLPIDRPINFPVYVTTAVSVFVGDNQTGSFTSLLNKNDDYNIAIKLKNPTNATQNVGSVAVQYDLRRAKLQTLSFSNQIGGQKSANLSFVTEIDLNDYNKGFYMSGQLNINALSTLSGMLLQENGDYLLQENGDRILVYQIAPLF